MFGTHIGAAAVVTPVALVHGLHPSDLSTADLARILTLVCTSGVTAHMLINWAHPYVKVSLSSVLVLLTPVVASVAAWVALDESLNGIQLLGGAVTLIAIAAITRTSSAEEVESKLQEIPEPVS
jgi:drug/metabolite transporter (DMT)-like permease